MYCKFPAFVYEYGRASIVPVSDELGDYYEVNLLPYKVNDSKFVLSVEMEKDELLQLKNEIERVLSEADESR